MHPRLNPYATAPGAIQPMTDMEDYLKACGLEHSLVELVKMRASQINGCAFCLHMHSRDARAAGETETRLYLLSGWRESRLYTLRERAALEWTEALTLVAQTQAPDAAYEAVKTRFTPKEIVDLTMLIGTINSWNRLAIGFRTVHPDDARHAAVA